MPRRLTIYFSNTEKLPEILDRLAEKYKLNKSDIVKYLVIKGLEAIKDDDRGLQLYSKLAQLEQAIREENQLYRTWKSFLRSYDKAYLLHDQPKEMLRAERIKELIERCPDLKDPLETLLNLRIRASEKQKKILREIQQLIKGEGYKPLEELLEERP